MIKTIGIIGQGFVGTAVREGLRPFFEVATYDKRHGTTLYRASAEVRGPEPENPLLWVLESRLDGPVFVCQPLRQCAETAAATRASWRRRSSLSTRQQRRLAGAVAVIKSTVPPGTTERLNRGRKAISVCFSPEFLREVTHLQDLVNQDRIIVGGPPEGTAFVAETFRQSFPKVPLLVTTPTIAVMVKYTTNAFLAVKVSLANELRAICEKLGIDYARMVECATLDSRLGTSHWAVPGPDGKAGFSGSCFPKDLNALMSVAAALGVPHHTMRGAWETNLAVRPERDWEQLHGRGVNYK